MNWKFWTWPAQIRALQTVVAKHEELLFAQDLNPPSATPIRFNDAQWQAKLAELRAALAVTLPDNALLTGVLGLLEWHARDEMAAGCKADVSTEETHRFRGRLGMALEIRQELEEYWRDARAHPPTAKTQ